ncbi:MAG: Gfo/Idh/MocA family oxidoreductase [Candidatus Sumerlaeia bacterium]
MEKLRVATIGVGHLGQHHARLLAQNENCDLVAVVDKDISRAEKIAKQWECQAFDDYEKLLTDKMVDAVSIAVPTSLHHKVATRFLEEKVHCLVEKPITVTVEEAESLIALAEKNDCVLQVGHIERYNAAIRHLREILDVPGFVECHRLGPFSSRVSDVGVVLDLMIHDIDIVFQIVNSPLVDMDAVGVNILTDKEDIANVRMKFENGCTANLTVSRVSPKPTRKIRIFQKDMYVSIDYAKQSMQIYQRVPKDKPKPGEAQADIVRKRKRIKKEDMLTLELDDFLKTIIKGGNPTVTGQHARDALQTAVRIAKMIEENQRSMELFQKA